MSRRSAKIRRHGGNQGQSKPVIPRPAHQGSRRGGLGAMLGHALTGLKSRLPTLAVVAVVALGAGIIITRFLGGPTQGVVVAVEVPGLSPTAERGKLAYDANCAQCHGENGAGTDLGPSLIHDIYNPGHNATTGPSATCRPSPRWAAARSRPSSDISASFRRPTASSSGPTGCSAKRTISRLRSLVRGGWADTWRWEQIQTKRGNSGENSVPAGNDKA